MRNSPHSIDGFVPRASRRSLGDTSGARLPRAGESSRQQLGTPSPKPITTTLPPPRRISRQDIDDSLKDIDDEPQAPKKRGFLRRKKSAKAHTQRKVWIKRVIKLLAILLVLVGLYVGVTAFINASKVFKGNPFAALFQNKPLKMDANGRTNVLVYGTSGSVEDGDHPGANLTDTLMIISVDQNKKNAYMVSLPRDLYVEYGEACPEGNRGRINSMYECFSEGGDDQASDEKGAKALEGKVTEITGLSIQYYAHINWAVVVGAVNALGGVNVNVEGNGSCAGFGMPQGSIVDVNMKFRYPPGERSMDGEEALKFSRARGSAGGCGLSRGDFDRQANQQKVLKAMQKKATSSETLLDVGKVTGLINALGENLRTNFESAEIQTLISLARDIPSDKIIPIDLAADDAQLIGGDMINGASVQIPTAGTFDYSAIQTYIRKNLNSNAVTKENASVALFNGSGITGYAKERSDALTERGFTIGAIDNAPSGKYGRVEIYDISGEKPATLAALAKIYGVTVKKTASPIDVSVDTDIVVIYGPTKSAN